MGIRKYKPTTPGRRGSSVSDFAELTRSTPEKSLLVPVKKTGGRNNQGRITTRHIGGGHKQAYRIIDFKRYDKDGVPAKVAHIEYDPNRTARDRAAALRGRREALHHRPARPRAGRDGRGRRGRRHQAGQQPAAAQHPGRHHGARRGAASRWRRQDGPLRRRPHPAGRPRGPDGHPASALGRDAHGRRPLPRDGRRGRQRRAEQHQLGQGRPQPLEGHPPDRPWCRHEPDRPPARWWRGSHLRWSSPGDARGASPRAAPARRTRRARKLIVRRRKAGKKR